MSFCGTAMARGRCLFHCFLVLKALVTGSNIVWCFLTLGEAYLHHLKDTTDLFDDIGNREQSYVLSSLIEMYI